MSTARSEHDAISLLKHDHETVKDLFENFEKSESPSEVQKIIDKAVQELKVHATIEEEIFYPAIRGKVGDDLMDEAREEHHVARVLIAELDTLKGDEARRNAKFKVLAEGVRHHIKEEEGEIFPHAKRLDMDFQSLGEQMQQRKDELQTDGVPSDPEHQMVSRAHRIEDAEGAASPSKGKAPAAREKTTLADGRKPGRKATPEKTRK